MKIYFFLVSGPSFGCFWIVLRFWPKLFMKNACLLPKMAEGWDFGRFGEFHKIIKIGHFLMMKIFFESKFLMSYEGLFLLGVKLHKCEKVYSKCVVTQSLTLLKSGFFYKFKVKKAILAVLLKIIMEITLFLIFQIYKLLIYDQGIHTFYQKLYWEQMKWPLMIFMLQEANFDCLFWPLWPKKDKNIPLLDWQCIFFVCFPWF